MRTKIVFLLIALLGSGSAGNAQVTATITASPGTMVCDNQNVTFTVAITGCTSSYTVDWIKNGFVQNTCSSPCTTWTTMLSSGTPQIWCSVNCSPQGNDNSNVLAMTVDPCSGIEELDHASLITVYPNPSTENITIDFIGTGNSTYILSVFDQTGKSVKVSYQMQTNSAMLNAKQFPQGLYYFKLTNEEGKKYAAGKFIINK